MKKSRQRIGQGRLFIAREGALLVDVEIRKRLMAVWIATSYLGLHNKEGDMCTNAMSIARRHLGIIVRLCEMSEQDEPIAELVRATVRNCLLAMQTAGTEPMEAAEIIEQLLQHELAALPAERAKCRKVLEAAHLHAEYLTMAERRATH